MSTITCGLRQREDGVQCVVLTLEDYTLTMPAVVARVIGAQLVMLAALIDDEECAEEDECEDRDGGTLQ